MSNKQTSRKSKVLSETKRGTGGFGSTNKDLREFKEENSRPTYPAEINDQPVQVLVDSGADGNFIYSNMIKGLGITTSEGKTHRITMANGQAYEVNTIAKDI